MRNQDKINELLGRAEKVVHDKGGFTPEFEDELREMALSPSMVLHHIRRKMDDEVGCWS